MKKIFTVLLCVSSVVTIFGMGAFTRFTKLDKNGNELSVQNKDWSDEGTESDGAKWSCARDGKTGLIWEVKTNDGGVRDKNNTYRWGGKTAINNGVGEYFDDWNTLVDAANSEQLCGYSDWRVPTPDELQTILKKKRKGKAPFINTDIFPNTPRKSFYWSTNPNDSNDKQAVGQQFNDYAFIYNGRKEQGSVRLVRGAQ